MFPRGTDLAGITLAHADHVGIIVNSQHRRSLDYQGPTAIYHALAARVRRPSLIGGGCVASSFRCSAAGHEDQQPKATSDSKPSSQGGGWMSQRRVTRIGSTVRRPITESTALLAELLPYLHRSGFRYAPEFLDADDDGYEAVSWVPGTAVPDEEAWKLGLDQLMELGGVIRELHSLTQQWRPTSAKLSSKWQIDGDLVISHGDIAPRNTIWRDGSIVALIDWERACLAPRWWDIAYAAWQFVPFWADADLISRAWDRLPDRRARSAALLGGYGWNEPSAFNLHPALLAVMRGTLTDLSQRAYVARDEVGMREIGDTVRLVERAITAVVGGQDLA